MTTLAEMRALVREELNDSGGTTLWTSALLNRHIADAIRSYSRDLPLKKRATITVVADQDEYDLPADLITIDRLTQPTHWLRRRVDPMRTSEGDPTQSTQLVDYQSRVGIAGNPATFWTHGMALYLDPAPGSEGTDQDITLWYGAYYPLPAADGDTLATPEGDDDLINHLTCAFALAWIATDEAKRQRFTDKTGSSPSAATARHTAYVQAVINKRKGFRTSTLEPI